MKLEAGKDVYPLTDFGEMASSVVVDTGVREMTGHCYALRQVTIQDLARMRRADPKDRLRGVPVWWAIGPSTDGSVGGLTLCLYPAPDKDYDLIGSYHPAARPL